MTQTIEAYDGRGRTLIDKHGEKGGSVDETYVDQQNGQLRTSNGRSTEWRR